MKNQGLDSCAREQVALREAMVLCRCLALAATRPGLDSLMAERGPKPETLKP